MRKSFLARRGLAALLTLAMVLSLTPAVFAVPPAPTITVSPATVELARGGTQTLTATVGDVQDARVAVTWSSDNPAVTVTGNGTSATIRGVSTGAANITATATATDVNDQTTSTASATVAVTVLPRVTLTQISVNMDIGQFNDNLKLRVDDVETTTGVTWSSNNDKAAVVNRSTGRVVAVGGGTATITGTYNYQGRNISASCTVSVRELTITLEPSSFTLTAGVAQEVKATANYDRNALEDLGGGWDLASHSTGITVTEKESDSRQCVFEVKADNETKLDQYFDVVYQYTVLGTSYEKKERVDKLGVKYPEIAFSPEKLTMTVGGEERVTARLVGLAVNDAVWDWELVRGNNLIDLEKNTNDPSIVTVKAKGKGTALIKAKYMSGTNVVKAQEYEIEIEGFTPPAVTITPTPGGNKLTEGQTLTLKAAASPEMTGDWSWEVDPTRGAVDVDTTDSNTGLNKDTLVLKANEYSADYQNDIAVKATFTLTGSAATAAAAVGAKSEYTATYNFIVEEADYTLELDKTSLSFDLMKPNPQIVTATLKKGGREVDGEDVDVETDRAVAEVSWIGRTVNGKISLTVTPLGTGKTTAKVTFTSAPNPNTGLTNTVTKTFDIEVTGPSIKLDKSSMNLDLVGEKNGELTATLEPAGTLADVRWEVFMPLSSNPNEPSKWPSKVISITHDSMGHCLVRAEQNGSAIIVATYELSSGTVTGTVRAKCRVNVGEYHFSISPDTAQLKEPGDSVKIDALVQKADGSDAMQYQEANITWQLSDASVARFSEAAPGVAQVRGSRSVTVLSRGNSATGTVTVTARWKYATYDEVRTIDITFDAAEAVSFAFTLKDSTVTGEVGGDLTQTPTTGAIQWNTGKTYPVPGDFKPVYTYTSSDTQVARVENGKVVAVGPGEATITVNGSATANGKAIQAGETKSYKVVVSADVTVKSIKLSASSVSLDPGKSQTVTATTDPEGAAVVWTSSDEKVVSVNNGNITAVGAGEATVTAAAGGKTAEVKVTVNGFKQLLDEITIIEGKSVDVGTIFTTHGAATGRSPVYASQDPNVASYSNGRITGNKVGRTEVTISSGTYRITVKVTVVADAASTIELPTMYTQTQKVLQFRDFMARFREQAGGSLDHITGLNVDTAKGTLYYNYTSENDPGVGVGAENYYLSASAGQREIEGLAFVPKPGYSGRVTINYTAVSRAGQNYLCSIVFDVDPGSGSSSGLNLSTPYNTPLKFSGADFNRVCQDRLGARLDYVTFSQPSSQQGTLYTNYVSAGNYGSVVDMRNHYGQKALDDVWFVPAPGFSGSVVVYYTAYGVGGGTYTGQVNIAVGWENGAAIGGLTYDIPRGGVAYFDDFKFSSYCRQVLDSSKSLSYIRFSALPLESEGVLYYNYNASGRSRAATNTSYYYNSSSPYIDRLAFAAASGFTGTVRIPFTGWTTDGVSFTGNVEINVQGGSGSSSAGDIVYICAAGNTVNFDDTDFNSLSRSRTGRGLNYIQFSSLPGSASGSVYYNNTRATTSARYRNGSGTPRIDNLSFRASGSFYGSVDIPFVGYATDGSSFNGVVTVATSSSAIGSGSAGASQTVFTDMGGYSDAQRAAVDFLYDRGVTRGVTTNQYGPEQTIRRGDFARMLYLAFEFTPSAGTRAFQDVAPTAYYAQAVNALQARGVVSGIGGGLYDPDGTLSRQDAVCMVQRAMRAVGWSANDGSVSALYAYLDGGSVDGYAQGAVAFAVQRGFLPMRYGMISPTQALTRVDMAEILYRVLNN